MEQINSDVIYFLLILLRISGIFMFTPIFSNRAFKRRMRLGFCFVLTVLLFNLVPKPDLILQNLNFFYLTVLLLKEILIGALMGYFVLLMFTVVQTASQIYSINMGLVMASVFDPISQLQIPVLGQVKYLFLTGLFFVYGIHRRILSVLIETFYKYPIGTLEYKAAGIWKFTLETFVYYFAISLQVALPILGVLLLIDIVLGVMARIAPQMNVFFIGMPLKILVGLMVLIYFVPYFTSFMSLILDDLIMKLIKLVTVSLA